MTPMPDDPRSISPLQPAGGADDAGASAPEPSLVTRIDASRTADRATTEPLAEGDEDAPSTGRVDAAAATDGRETRDASEPGAPPDEGRSLPK